MQHIKKIYLYTVSLISLVIVVAGAIMLINLGLKTWVFTKADSTDYYYEPQMICGGVMKNPDGTTSTVAPADCPVPARDANKEKIDQERRAAQKQRDAAQAVAMIIVGAPVFYYHWKLARKEA
jgi:hypothetical protein